MSLVKNSKPGKSVAFPDQVSHHTERTNVSGRLIQMQRVNSESPSRGIMLTLCIAYVCDTEKNFLHRKQLYMSTACVQFVASELTIVYLKYLRLCGPEVEEQP